MQRMSERIENCRSIDLDELSHISPLQCGSIVPTPEYNPSRVPMNVARVPPLEIYVKGKFEVPEWLRLDSSDCPPNRPILNRVSSAPSDRNDFGNDLRRQISWDSRGVELRDILEEPRFPLTAMQGILYSNQKPCHESFWCAKSTASAGGTLHTSPTDLSGEENESLWLEIVPKRIAMDIKLFTGRFPLFHKRRKSVSLRRSRGCLT
jgi:hypothetical protein